MKQCLRCNNQVDDKLNICNICRFRFHSQTESLPPPPPPTIQTPQSSSQTLHQQPSKIQQFSDKKDNGNNKNLKLFLIFSVILNLLLFGILIVLSDDTIFEDSLKSQYNKEDEVLNRDRVIFRKYDVILDWKGHQKTSSPDWKYTMEWKLSSYIESLRRDHSINYLDRDSVIKYVDSWVKESFYFENLHNSFPDEADMANAILDVVHMLEYKNDPLEIEDVRYPDETLIEGCGDCEDLVMLCAAMLEGNGLDAVFIVWQDHAQAAVYLENPPKTDSGTVWYVPHNGKKYYICESTGDYNWDVGEMPPEQQNQTPVIIHDV